MRTRRTSVLVGLLAMMPACTSERSDIDPERLSVSDSAGIRSYRIDSLSGEDMATRRLWTFGPGGADGDVYLGAIVDGRLMPAGGAVIADPLEGSALRLDSLGTLIWRFGRRGEGPEEFQRLANIWLSPTRSTLLFDVAQQKIVSLGEEGDLEQVVSIRGTTLRSAVAYDGQTFWLAERIVPSRMDGLVRPSLAVTTWHPASNVEAAVDTFPGDELTATPTDRGSLMIGRAAYGRLGRFAGAGGLVGYLDSETSSIRLYDGSSGEVTGHVTVLSPKPAATEDDFDAWMRVAAGDAAPGSPVHERIENAQRALLAHDSLPVVDDFRLESEGVFWLKRYAVSGEEVWCRIDFPDQRILCTELAPDATLLDANDRFILVRRTGGSGEERVEVWGHGYPG